MKWNWRKHGRQWGLNLGGSHWMSSFVMAMTDGIDSSRLKCYLTKISFQVFNGRNLGKEGGKSNFSAWENKATNSLQPTLLSSHIQDATIIPSSH